MLSDPHDHQLAILKLAKEKGMNPTRLSPSQYTMLSVQLRGTKQLVSDVKTALLSRTLTTLGLRVVSLEQAQKNEDICRSNECGRFREIISKKPGGAPRLACDACNCTGKWLKSKLRDAAEACPLGYWTNQGESSEEPDHARNPE